MPAITFFTMLKAAEEIKRVEETNFYLELCDIQAISICTSDYYKDLKSRYYSRINSDPEKPRRGALKPDDPKAKLKMAHMVGMYRQAMHV